MPAQEQPPGAVPFHPLLAAAFPILSLYARNMGEFPLHQLWRPLGVAVAGQLALWGLAALLTRHVRKAALAASALALAFLSYGHVARAIPYSLRGLEPVPYLLGVAAMITLLVRVRRPLVRITAGANVAALVLVAPSVTVIAQRALSSSGGPDGHFAGEVSRSRSASAQASGGAAGAGPTAGRGWSTPDVYYIILDAYGRADSLKTFYGYDNTPFIRALRQRGFYVANHSRANYSQTGYSLPTSLNMAYLSDQLRGQRPGGNLTEVLRRRIDENAVAAHLSALGYQYISIWTGTGIARVESSDIRLGGDTWEPPTSLGRQVLALSALGPAPISFASDYDRQRGMINAGFHNLDVVASLSAPKFVFAHISAPHPPFVFGPRGEPVEPPYPYSEDDGSSLVGRISRQAYQRGYTGQLGYVNRRTLQAVDNIVRRSARPPVIIIQGDHGSRMTMNWNSLAKTDLREPYPILNAYLVPPRVRSRLYETITPVNTFRLLLTRMFGGNYPLLPDRSYFSTVGDPLHFTDVTDRIPCADCADSRGVHRSPSAIPDADGRRETRDGGTRGQVPGVLSPYGPLSARPRGLPSCHFAQSKKRPPYSWPRTIRPRA